MPKWSKEADWLPLDNAKAQVLFYTKDLEYSKKYLEFVKKIKPKVPSKFYLKMLKIADKDYIDSVNNLNKAIEKLKESEQLE